MTGIIPDAVSVIGSLLNFTMSYHGYTIERIGTAPKEFPANASGKWGDLFGEVFNGNYQLSVSYWNNRHGSPDFTFVKCISLMLDVHLTNYLYSMSVLKS